MTTKILVLYYSRNGSVRAMMHEIVKGVESVHACEAMIRTVPPVAPMTEAHQHEAPEEKHLYVTVEDLKSCHGLIMGSPTRFGNMAAPLKYFWDTTGKEWFSGTLIGKPAAFFTSTSTMHGGQETTLLSMMIPLLHHGAILVGVPASVPETLSTQTGGSFYGATHVAGTAGSAALSQEEITICRALGKRLAEVATKLSR